MRRFSSQSFPRRIVIQGGGYIAVEFACIFAGLGFEVTLVYRGENILRGFDDDVRSHLRAEMENTASGLLPVAPSPRSRIWGRIIRRKLSDGITSLRTA